MNSHTLNLGLVAQALIQCLNETVSETKVRSCLKISLPIFLLNLKTVVVTIATTYDHSMNSAVMSMYPK